MAERGGDGSGEDARAAGNGGASPCPDDEALSLFVEGGLDEAKRAVVESHLARCGACRSVIASMVRAATSSSEPSVPGTEPDPRPRAATAPTLGEDREAESPATFGANERGFGRYEVRRVLGAGAMGLVYAAWDPVLGREVALKVLRPCAQDPERDGGLRERLLREAQAMARVSHPNVIAVYDVGVFDDRVFLTMERIEGTTLREWLAEPGDAQPSAESSAPTAPRTGPRPWRRPRRSIAEILRAFVSAGEGLRAAHAAGLVHRDFKPDNVLVSADGRVLVTDFGVARVGVDVQGAFARGALLAGVPPVSATRTGLMIGTPSYMAPEQFEGRGVDARSDVFAFCASLWEALYGERPFEGGDVGALYASVRQGRLRDVSRARVPRRVEKALRRGLRPNPSERFQSMAPLLAILHAALPSRVRALSMIAGGLAVAVAALAVVAALGRPPAPCQGADEELAAVWGGSIASRVAARFAASGKPFAEDAARGASSLLDGYAARWRENHRAACEATRVRGEQSEAMLDLRMRCLAARKAELVAVVGALVSAEGSTIERAVHLAGALSDPSLCADAAALAERGAAVDPAQEEAARALEPKRARVFALLESDRPIEAMAEAKALHAAAKTIPRSQLYAWSLAYLGRAHLARHQHKEGVALIEDAIFTGIELHNDEVVARATTPLINVQNNAAPSFEVLKRWLRLGRAAVARMGNPPGLRAHVELAGARLFYEHGRDDEALPLFEGAVRDAVRAFGEIHPLSLDAAMGLAFSLGRHGKLKEAVERFDAAQPKVERLVGRRHPLMAQCLNGSAGFRSELGRGEEALGLYDEALRIFSEALGADSGPALTVLSNKGQALAELKRGLEALPLIQRAADGMRKLLGAKNVRVAVMERKVGDVLIELGRPREALARYEEALRIVEGVAGRETARAAKLLASIAESRVRMGEPAKAIPVAEESLAIATRVRAIPSTQGESRWRLAQAIAATGADRPRACGLAVEARAFYVTAGDRDEPPLIDKFLAASCPP